MNARNILICGRCLRLTQYGMGKPVSGKYKVYKSLLKRTTSSVANEGTETSLTEKGNYDRLHVSVLSDKVMEVLNPQNNQVSVN